MFDEFEDHICSELKGINIDHHIGHLEFGLSKTKKADKKTLVCNPMLHLRSVKRLPCY